MNKMVVVRFRWYFTVLSILFFGTSFLPDFIVDLGLVNAWITRISSVFCFLGTQLYKVVFTKDGYTIYLGKWKRLAFR